MSFGGGDRRIPPWASARQQLSLPPILLSSCSTASFLFFFLFSSFSCQVKSSHYRISPRVPFGTAGRNSIRDSMLLYLGRLIKNTKEKRIEREKEGEEKRILPPFSFFAVPQGSLSLSRSTPIQPTLSYRFVPLLSPIRRGIGQPWNDRPAEA